MLCKQKKKRERRRGALTIEALILIPIAIIFVLAFLELTKIETVKQQLNLASAQGARVASQGGSQRDVEKAVQQTLTFDRRNKAKVEVKAGQFTGDPVQVQVAIEAKEVVPDLLSFIGFSLHDKTLQARTVLRHE